MSQGCNITGAVRKKLSRLQEIGRRYASKRAEKLGKPSDKDMLEACREIGQQLSEGNAVTLRPDNIYGSMFVKFYNPETK